MLYTAQQIKDDFRKLEGIEAIFSTSNFQSNVLYSDVNDRTPNKATVEELKVKVGNFFDNYCFPLTDSAYSEEDFILTVYEGNDGNEIFTFVAKADSRSTTELDEVLTKISKTFILILDNQGNKVVYGSKILN